MSTQANESPIASPIQSLIALFEQELGDVAFPDVSLATLTQYVEAVNAQNNEVERLREALAAARDSLDERQQELLTHAQRALAYAKVYAGDDGELAEKLAAVNLSPRNNTQPAKRRKRKKSPSKTTTTRDTAAQLSLAKESDAAGEEPTAATA